MCILKFFLLQSFLEYTISVSTINLDINSLCLVTINVTIVFVMLIVFQLAIRFSRYLTVLASKCQWIDSVPSFG